MDPARPIIQVMGNYGNAPDVLSLVDGGPTLTSADPKVCRTRSITSPSIYVVSGAYITQGDQTVFVEPMLAHTHTISNEASNSLTYGTADRKPLLFQAATFIEFISPIV